MKNSIISSIKNIKKEEEEQILVGLWKDPHLLKNIQFDFILADYLIGSVDHFDRYFQPFLIDILFSKLRKGKRLFFKKKY